MNLLDEFSVVRHKIEKFRTCHRPNKDRYVNFYMFMSHVVANLKSLITRNKKTGIIRVPDEVFQDTSCKTGTIPGKPGRLGSLYKLQTIVLD